MLHARQPWTDISPYHYTPEPHATKAEIDRCTVCAFPPEMCDTCPYYEGLIKVVDSWLYIHVTKEVYRAERIVRQELGRNARVTKQV